MKRIILTAAALMACVAASSASAATIVSALPGGPFSIDNAVATIPSEGLDKGATYDFTFSWVGQQGVGLAQADTKGATPVMQFQLFSGVPGAGAFLMQSAAGPGASITFSARPGAYYAEVTPSQIGVGGALPSSVPEPATWALMIIGLGGLGGAVRARRAPAALA